MLLVCALGAAAAVSGADLHRLWDDRCQQCHGHAGEFARERTGEEIAGVALDLQLGAEIAGRRMGACVPSDADPAALGETAALRADVAFDMNLEARQKLRAKKIETRGAALKAKAL